MIVAVVQSQERMIVAAALPFYRDRERRERLNSYAQPADVHVVILLRNVRAARGGAARRAAEATGNVVSSTVRTRRVEYS